MRLIKAWAKYGDRRSVSRHCMHFVGYLVYSFSLHSTLVRTGYDDLASVEQYDIIIIGYIE
jgi:hypothetical protein